LIPLRIPYQAGVVLDLIVEDQEQESVVSGSNTCTGELQDSIKSTSILNPTNVGCLSGNDIASVAHRISNLSIATADAVDRSLVAQSALLDQQEEMSIQKFSQSNEVLCRTDNPKRLIQVPSVDQFIAERLKMMEMTGIQEGDLLQWHIIQQQQQILDKLQQTLNRQAVHENRIQALMT
jgi:hypothetical protein